MTMEHNTRLFFFFLTNYTLVLEGLKRTICFIHGRTKSGLKIAVNCITALKKELAVLYLSLNNNNSKKKFRTNCKMFVQKFKNITGSRSHLIASFIS